MTSFCKRILTLALGLTLPAVAGAETPTAPETSHPAVQGYHVSQTLKIGGEGRWDYVTIDPKTQLLYVPRQTHVQIIKAQSGEVIGDLKDTAGVHGVALVPAVNRGFASNGQSNNVTVFDLTTRLALGTVPAGQKPDAIIYDPASNKVLCFNGKSLDVTVIDPDVDLSKKAAAVNIPLGGAPEFAASDEAGHVYVNLEDKSSVVALDVKAQKVTATWKIEGGEEPTGLAIDIAHHRLFSGCHNDVMAVLDTETGKTLATVPIGKGVDACAFDPSTGEAFASCGDGTLTVIKETSPGKFAVTQTVQTARGARTMALDPATHMIYLPTAEFPQTTSGSGRPNAKPDSFKIVVVSPGSK